jgi:hypothetical protein
VTRGSAGRDGSRREGPLLEDSADGVRFMTAHRARGPGVPSGDPRGHHGEAHAGRADTVDASRNLAAIRLAGLSPWDLLDAEEAESAISPRACGSAYVAATRAR